MNSCNCRYPRLVGWPGSVAIRFPPPHASGCRRDRSTELRRILHGRPVDETNFTYLKITSWGWYSLLRAVRILALHRDLEAQSHDLRLRHHLHARPDTRGFRSWSDHRRAPARLLNDSESSYLADDLAVASKTKVWSMSAALRIAITRASTISRQRRCTSAERR